jgi:hypothetical protein
MLAVVVTPKTFADPETVKDLQLDRPYRTITAVFADGSEPMIFKHKSNTARGKINAMRASTGADGSVSKDERFRERLATAEKATIVIAF